MRVGEQGEAGVNNDEGYWALREGSGALRIARDVVRVTGPDAQSYLQGQTSQDIAKLTPGAWAWALVLQPQGKLDAFVRVYRSGPDDFVLDTDAGMGPHLVARLGRFKLRTKVDIDQLDWRVVAVRGPARPAAPDTASEGNGVAAAVPFEWGGLTGYDLFGPNPGLPREATAADVAAYEAVRVEAGFPRHGAELDERTIPAEAGLVDASVSFTKGCYTGQELVARIDSRGSNVPRHLRGLLLSGPAEAGARLHDLKSAGKEVGRLTSVAVSPRLGWVGLCYVGRSVEVGETVAVRDENAQRDVQALVQLLPQ